MRPLFIDLFPCASQTRIRAATPAQMKTQALKAMDRAVEYSSAWKMSDVSITKGGWITYQTVDVSPMPRYMERPSARARRSAHGQRQLVSALVSHAAELLVDEVYIGSSGKAMLPLDVLVLDPMSLSVALVQGHDLRVAVEQAKGNSTDSEKQRYVERHFESEALKKIEQV